MASVFNDPFTFMLIEVDGTGKTVRTHGGMDNIRAANPAFEALGKEYPHRRLMLRSGARIIKTLESNRDQQTQAPGTLP